MGDILTRVIIIDSDGDEADTLKDLVLHRSYTDQFRQTVTLVAGTKTAIHIPFADIQFVFLRTSATTRVYKNLSPESHEFSTLFFEFDTSFSQLNLMSPDGATVQVFVAGE